MLIRVRLSIVLSGVMMVLPAGAKPQAAPATTNPQAPTTRPLTASEINLKSVVMAAPPGMVVDGRLDEWNDLPIAITDPKDAPDSQVDFGVVKVVHDDRYVHMMFDIGARPANLQGLDGAGFVVLDVDGDASTGKTSSGLDGADAIIELTPPNRDRPGTSGRGIGLRSTMFQPPASQPGQKKDPSALNPYDIGLMFSPTHSARRFELRITRGSHIPDCPAWFTGQKFTFRFQFISLAGVPLDETDAVTYTLTPTTPTEPAAEAMAFDPLGRPPGTTVRVMSWNISRGAMFARPDPFARTLKAINPDVILLQELTDKNTTVELKGFFDQHLPLGPGQQWIAAVGEGGGDLRCGIASKKGLGNLPGIEVIKSSENPNQSIRIRTARVILSAERRILMSSLHLKCCGIAGGPEDKTRIAEARSVHAALRSVMPGGINAWNEPFWGHIIAGDFNLVGARTPLDMLTIQLDPDKTSMSIVEAYQLDQTSNVTWADRAQPFTPGRLDFMLYSDSLLKVLRAFVFNSRALDPAWAARHGVKDDDSDQASDHMPIVADFAIIEGGS